MASDSLPIDISYPNTHIRPFHHRKGPPSTMYTLPDLPASAARDADAMDAVAALHPTDALEVRLAVDIVAMETCGADSIALAGENRNDIVITMRCRAQASAMFRQMRALLREYRSMQAERDKAIAEMHPAAMERAGYWCYAIPAFSGGFSVTGRAVHKPVL
jgi:hypothetical protein